jgi:hypothetical protein
MVWFSVKASNVMFAVVIVLRSLVLNTSDRFPPSKLGINVEDNVTLQSNITKRQSC